ncbi:MAG: aminoacetone oxidase family FAD-binding enzyme, partial [Candidatus Moraniibacteriota bacterium]
GYMWLEKMGHTIIPPSPALVPIKLGEAWVKELQGVSLENVGISLMQNKQKIKLGIGEIIFTHFGLSGPAIINASKIIGEYLKKSEVSLGLDLLPNLKLSELEEKIKVDFEKYKKRNLKNYLSEYFPQKLVKVLMKLSRFEDDRKIYSLNKLERMSLAGLIKSIPVIVSSLLDFNHAMITSGGVSLKEINPKTMCSKIIDNLFFAGEVLDLDGPTGGYNLQIAWTTGYIAGNYAKNK